MVRGWLGLGMVFLTLLGLWGCGRENTPIVVQPQSGLERAKVILNDYVQGMPLGSEAMMFAEIVEEVRQTDPQKATILEKGFADLQRSARQPQRQGQRAAQATVNPRRHTVRGAAWTVGSLHLGGRGRRFPPVAFRLSSFCPRSFCQTCLRSQVRDTWLEKTGAEE